MAQVAAYRETPKRFNSANGGQYWKGTPMRYATKPCIDIKADYQPDLAQLRLYEKMQRAERFARNQSAHRAALARRAGDTFESDHARP